VTLPSDIYKHLLNNASKYAKENILRKFTYKEKCTCIINDFLLRELFYKNYGFRYGKNEIVINDFGKPFFRENCGYHFNFSHSDEYAVIALGEIFVGVDIEKIEAFNIKTKSLFVADQDYLSECKTKMSLCLLWTAKESYCKAVGYGLSVPPKDVHIIKEGSRFEVRRENDYQRWFVEHILLDDVVIAVCSNGWFYLKHNKVNIKETISNIIKYK
jgi:4'-phosphopantetheinyl transferase